MSRNEGLLSNQEKRKCKVSEIVISSVKGTVILQGFDAKKMTGGASGALRQEFREIELLDEIINLHYLG
jgi:hypothetical protein